MTPGDAFVDPLIARGEKLERIKSSTTDALTPTGEAELDSLKAYARSRIAHLAAYPLASTSQEESAQDLADEEARSAREREAAVLKAAESVLETLRPIVLAALATAATDLLTKR